MYPLRIGESEREKGRIEMKKKKKEAFYSDNLFFIFEGGAYCNNG
jgi:hypothetical protein